MTTSTLLTLLVVPVVYSVLDAGVERLRGRKVEEEPEEAEA